jgi:hypothetical protein
MSSRVVVALLSIISFLVVVGIVMIWQDSDKREAKYARAVAERARVKAIRDMIETNRTPPLTYGEEHGSFLSDRLLNVEEIEDRVAHPVVPTLVPGATIYACFARVTWVRSDCRVTLHWWFEEIPLQNPKGPRLRLDFDKTEHELNHQDYLGPLPPKCRPFPLPEQLKPGRRYAMGSKDTAVCPGADSYGPIYVTPPEMEFMAGAK